VQIDRGQRDGVLSNMPVVTAEGLVGKVRQVGYSTSQVVLIGDPDCRVTAVVIEDPPAKGAGIPGVISANSASVLDPTIVILTFVDRQSTVRPGQTVLTRGIVPKGILIGHVVDTSSVWFGVYTEARVKLAANLRQLDQVWIVFQ
jgi:rod shape-determining protein MreC